MNIVVLGAGAWGTAMAVSAAAHPCAHAVTLWARDAQQVAGMQAARQNARYLPDIELPSSLALSAGDPLSLACGADLVVVATPMSALRGMLQALSALDVPVAWLCKGFEAAPPGGSAVGLMGHEVCAQVAPACAAGH